MSRGNSCVLFLVLAAGCGSDSGTGPSSTPESVSVTFPAGGTIFIGNAVQFEARVTSSDGTSRDVTNEATWGSDAPTVATVSSTGLVTAVAAGQATIFAEVNPRGSMQIRVFPDFGGSWAGNEVFAACEASGAFEGFCDLPGFRVGDVFPHRSMFIQNAASVDATIFTGDGTKATMTGNITVGGELQLPTAPVLPAEPMVNAELQNWRSRADTPSRMTGSYEGFFTAPGLPGSVTVKVRLENVVKTAATSLPPSSTATQQALRTIAAHLEARR